MNLNIDSLVTFILIWGIPAFMVTKSYLKMHTDDKKSAINDFKSRGFIFTIGFIVIGTLFTHLGNLFAISIIKVIGISFFILGGIFSMIDMWRKSKMKSLLILVLLSVVIFLNIY
ncbi:hypothetical protein [Peribacillus muralis]|uniref:hypothetical protein n=1 Tax=Peribacillus muralis TaxID=264697 RepID=UPI003D03DAA9